PSWTTSAAQREEPSTAAADPMKEPVKEPVTDPEVQAKPTAPEASAARGAVELFPTKNDLPEAARAQLIELLNSRLADAIDLATQCKQAHWNVKGPAFFSLHQLFDELSADVRGYVD